MNLPKIKGRKLSKEEYTFYLGRELAYQDNVRVSPKHKERAIELVRQGAYDEYLKQFKKVKEPTKEAE